MILQNKLKQYKIVVEKYPDTYVAYPLGMKGVVVGQGDTYEAALADVKSAIKFHIDTFGSEEIETDPPNINTSYYINPNRNIQR